MNYYYFSADTITCAMAELRSWHVCVPVALLLFHLDASQSTVTIESCSSSADQHWAFDEGAGLLVSSATGDCLTAQTWPVADGTSVLMLPCGSVAPAQQAFDYVSGNNTLVLRADPSKCANVAQYGKQPGAVVWLYTCSSSDCEGNCEWNVNGSAWVNPISGLCLDDGQGPALPYSCAPSSPSHGLPFCDYTLAVEARIADLIARMDVQTKINQFSIPAGRFTYNSALNLKGFRWDLTCMRGIAPGDMQPILNVTVFPHAIGLAATWDTDLYRRVAAATAIEGRIVNLINYNNSGGTSWQGVQCDGGPLANTQHDPRWGRVSETYGEDPYLSAVLGVAATLSLQNRSADGRWMQTSQVTRHYLGYHVASDLPNGGEEYIDLFSFTDQQELPYRSFQVEGGAEGIMCAMSAFAIGDRSDWRTPQAPMIPSCVHPFLWSKLRDQWGSECFVQTDCCDSINEMVNSHHYFPDIASAALGAIEMGLQASYGPNENIDDAIADMINNGTLDDGLLDTRIARTLLTRFRLGEFDIGNNPDFPFPADAYTASDLDGPANRALAREAAAASVVLLKNDNSLLPLNSSTLGPGKRLAVIGPFANCTCTEGGYGNHDQDDPFQCSYIHSYGGYTSAVSTIIDAMVEDGNATGFETAYVQGSNMLTSIPESAGNGIAAAVSAAEYADVTLLVVGLGALVEHEGQDRVNLTLPAAQQALVDAVSAAVPASKLILVIVSAGGVDTTYVNAGAAIQYFYPGEEGGHGLADVLFGRVSPAGRLPITIYKQEYLQYIDPVAYFTMITSQGTGRTYRYFTDNVTAPSEKAAEPSPSEKAAELGDAFDGASQFGAPATVLPLPQARISSSNSLVHYWFGYGLSYSSFLYSDLTAAVVSPLPGPGALDNTTLVNINVDVAIATSSFCAASGTAAEVAQVYVIPPSDAAAQNATHGAAIPKYNLVGFQKVRLDCSASGIPAAASTSSAPSAAAPLTLQFALPIRAFQLTTLSGERVLMHGGSYTIAVSGHLPDDPNSGSAVPVAGSSNVVSTSFTLP